MYSIRIEILRLYLRAAAVSVLARGKDSIVQIGAKSINTNNRKNFTSKI